MSASLAHELSALIDELREADRLSDEEERFRRRLELVQRRCDPARADARWRAFLVARRHLIARAGVLGLLAAAEAEPMLSAIAAATREARPSLRLVWRAGTPAAGDHQRIARVETCYPDRGSIGGITLSPVRRQAFSCDGYAAYRVDLETGAWLERRLDDWPTLGRAALVGGDRVAAFHDARSSGGTGGAIHLWSLDTLASRRLWKIGAEVTAIAGSAVGDRIAFAAGTALRWGAPDAPRTSSLKLAEPAGALAFSPDGRTIAVGCERGPLLLVDPAGRTGRTTPSPIPIADDARSIAVTDLHFTRDGERLVVAGFIEDFEPVIEVWQLRPARRVLCLQHELPGARGVSGAHLVTLSPDERRVYGVERGEYLSAWDLESGAWLGCIRTADASPLALSTLDADRVALAGELRGMGLWDVSRLDLGPSEAPAHGRDLSFARGGACLVSAGSGALVVSGVGPIEPFRRLEIPVGKRATWEPEPSFVVRGDSAIAWYEAPDDEGHGDDHVDRRVRSVDLVTGALRILPGAPPLRPASEDAARVPLGDGRREVGSDADGVIKLWDDGGEPRTIGVIDSQVRAIAVAPDGAIAVQGDYGELALFTLDEGVPLTGTNVETPATREGGELVRALASLRDGSARVFALERPAVDLASVPAEEARALRTTLELIASSQEDAHVADEEKLLRRAEKTLAGALTASPSAAFAEVAFRLAEALLEVVLDDALERHARRWLELASGAGHLDAKWVLGRELFDGFTFKENEKLGRALIAEAGAAGQREALHWEGTERVDDGEVADGLEWVARAANLGETLGFAALGRYLEEGRLGPPDLELARRAYTLAADVDYAAANLAIMWRDGLGGPADRERAEHFYRESKELSYDWKEDGRWRRSSKPRSGRHDAP